MKCPFCGQKLQRGVLQSTHSMFWQEQPTRFPAKPGHHNSAEPLCSQGDGIRDWPYVSAYRCPDCKWLFVDADGCHAERSFENAWPISGECPNERYSDKIEL